MGGAELIDQVLQLLFSFPKLEGLASEVHAEHVNSLSSGRKKLIAIWLGILFLPGFATLAADEELWPFSHYPMYSRMIYGFKWAQIRGVERESDRETLVLSNRPFSPLSQIRVTYTFYYMFRDRLHAEPDLRPRLMRHTEALSRLLSLNASLFPEVREQIQGWRSIRVYGLRYPPQIGEAQTPGGPYDAFFPPHEVLMSEAPLRLQPEVSP